MLNLLLNKKAFITSLILFFICLILYTWVRVPMFADVNLYKDWNSDNAIFVLMSEDIKTLTDFPFYYWGGNYLGPFNNMAMAFTQFLFEVFNFSENVPHISDKSFIIGPFVASFTCFWLLFLAYMVLFKALTLQYKTRNVALVLIILSLGNALLIKTSLRPLGPEVALLLGALILWRGLILVRSNTFKNQLLLGLSIGLSWWMNQITVFVIAPVFFHFISPLPEYSFFRNNYPWKDSLLLKARSLNHDKLKKPVRAFLLFSYLLIGLNLLMGAFVAVMDGVNTRLWGIKLKIHNGFSPMKTSIIIFIVFQLILWFFLNRESRKKVIYYAKKIKPFLIGFFIGYGPVVIGRVLGFYEKGYKPTFKFIAPNNLLPYWQRLFTDFFPKLMGVEATAQIVLLYTGLAILLLSSFRNYKSQIKNYLLLRSGSHSERSICWAIIYFNLIYIFFCERSRNQYAFRYAILSIPVILIYLTTFLSWKRKGLSIIATTLIILIGSGFYRQGQREIDRMTASFDIRPVVKKILSSNCEVIYADYFWAYLLEYFSQKERLFFVSRGFKRTPTRNLNLIEKDAIKCDFNEIDKSIREI